MTATTRPRAAEPDRQEAIHDIALELLRPGPAHNQLLSPLVSYLALCGAAPAVTVRPGFDHAQLLARLDRLRYQVDGVAAPARQRQAELEDIGLAMGRLLAGIPALVSALQAAGREPERRVNVQLKISALELALMPFEAAFSPVDVEFDPAPLLLHACTTLTREIRRGEPLALDWNRPPKILVAFASPTDLPAVPAQEHVDALRRAIEPWIGLRDTAAERLADVRERLTVLPDASVARIAAACEAHDYTHVHLLAHGAPLVDAAPPGAGQRFGLCLAPDPGDGSPAGHVVVDAQRLALALTPARPHGHSPAPTLVTLATCDSGNVGSVLTPGGSIAHELHAHDIPWVVASQFPLSMRASSRCAELLYGPLLAGDDPRRVLHALRQRLRIEMPQTHDWASIVCYAAVAPDLASQVDAFRARQTESRLEVLFERIDALVGRSAPAAPAAADVSAELQALFGTVRAELTAWCDEPGVRDDRPALARRLAMRAASEKRIAIASALLAASAVRSGSAPLASAQSDPNATSASFALHGEPGNAAEPHRLSLAAYRQSRRWYEAALHAEPANHWAITQFLALAATPALAPSSPELEAVALRYAAWWVTARQLAEWDALEGPPRRRAWAFGSLAELELLGVVYAAADGRPETMRRDAVVEACRQLRALSSADAFPIASTRRQWRRYLDHWPRPCWNALAQAGLDALDAG